MEARHGGAARLRKSFVAWDDVMAIAEQEDANDYASRDLRFQVLFLLAVLPFLGLQARTQQRFESLQRVKRVLEETPFFSTEATTEFRNVSVFGATPQMLKVPLLFVPDPLGSRDLTTSQTFADINSGVEYWSWLQQVVGQRILLPQFCAIMSTAESEEYTQFWALEDPEWLADLGATREAVCKDLPRPDIEVLTGARIRQVAVTTTSCNSVIKGCLEDYGCYEGFSPSNEAKSNSRWGRLKVNKSSSFASELNEYVFNWEQEAVLQDTPLRADLGVYPGSGFAATLPMHNSSYFAVVNKLSQYREGLVSWDRNLPQAPDGASAFLQPWTRLVVLVMTLYSPSTNLYTYVEAYGEVTAAGSINNRINYYIAPAPTHDLQSPEERAELVFAALTFMALLLAMLRFARNANMYRLTMTWFLIELLNLALYVLTMQWIVGSYFNLSNAPEMPDRRTFRNLVQDPLWICPTGKGNPETGGGVYEPCGGQPPFFSQAGAFAKAYQDMQLVFAALVLVNTARILRSLYAFKRFHLFAEALLEARYSRLSFAVIFLVMFLGYSLAGALFYGGELYEYRNLWASAFSTLLSFARVDVEYRRLEGVNAAANIFGPIYFFSFAFIFMWIFVSVLLALIYNSWNKVKEASYAVERKSWARRIERERLATLYAQGQEVDRSCVLERVRSDKTFAVLGRMISDKQYRAQGSALLLERFCLRTRPGWVSKEWARISLAEWKRDPANASQHFLDAKLLREALRGESGPAVPATQVHYYFSKLQHKTYSKVEVDQLVSQIELGRRGEGEDPVTGGGPSLSMRKSIATTVRNMAKDQDIWLLQLDRYLASLRVRQAKATDDVARLARGIDQLHAYSR